MLCNKCGDTNPTSFWPSMTYQCKDCAREYRAKPDVLRRKRDQQLKFQYGITREEFDEMVAAQDNSCAICDVEMDPPHVDHCHKTGSVRGLLCKHCNLGLGHFRDDPSTLATAIDYLN